MVACPRVELLFVVLLPESSQETHSPCFITALALDVLLAGLLVFRKGVVGWHVVGGATRRIAENGSNIKRDRHRCKEPEIEMRVFRQIGALDDAVRWVYAPIGLERKREEESER